MHARLRNKITKAKDLNYDFRVVSVEDVLPMVLDTYKRKNKKLPFDARRLAHLAKQLEERSAIQSLGAFNTEGKLMAVLGLFYDSKTAYLILNGTSEELKDKGINELLIYHGIEWAKANGQSTFDFEGSMIPSIESFYRQFGGRLTPYDVIWKESQHKRLRSLKQRLF